MSAVRHNTSEDAPAYLYRGQVMHARLNPFSHRFTYDVFNLLIDLDRLDEADKESALFSVNRSNILAFHESDHLPHGRKSSLRDYADELLAKAGVEKPEKIRLMAYPRCFGFVFNPIAVYYCEAADSTLSAIIYEVRNTFGDRHTYVCPVDQNGETNAYRQERAKLFHVSPFMDMAQRYRFRLNNPDERLRLRILETDANGAPMLAATYAADRKPFTTKSIAAHLLRFPFLTMKVVLAIHWQAMKLWRKGAVYHDRIKPDQPVSVQDVIIQPAE